MENEIREYDGLMGILDGLEKAQMSKGTIELGMNRYLEQKARDRGFPIRGTFELTPLCNLDCKMCYVHLSNGQLCNAGLKVLSGDEWIAIMDQAIESGIMTVLLTGGEAMLHPDFDKIFLHLQSKGLNVCINTNGILLTEKRIEFFQRNKPKEIRVTLYGADEDTYEKVTGHRSFSIVLENLYRAKAAGLHLGMNITPNCYMTVEECLSLVRLADSIGIAHMINMSLSEPREGTGRENTCHDWALDQYIELYRALRQMKKEELRTTCESELPDTGNNKRIIKGIRCGAGRSSFAVLWHGILQPCLSMDNIRFDLTTMRFAEAWRTMNRLACDYPVPMECEDCSYRHLCIACVVRHASGAPLGHANPELCARAKRMVIEGLAVLS